MAEQTYRVTTLELFFDLVFAFTITQLTNVLVHEMSLLGLVRVVMPFGVLWWLYAGYAWLTNTIAPTGTVRRLLLLLGMAGFLVVALATPRAFHGDELAWGLGYLLVVLVHAGLYQLGNRHIFRVLPFNVAAAILIIVAGLLSGPWVYVLWTAAVIIPIVMPSIVPPGGRFIIQPSHIVERHGALVIITLGESVVAVGIGMAGLRLTPGLILVAVLGLALAAALWWSYFTGDDERAEEVLTRADDVERTRLTMNGYFYAHIPIVIGIVAMAAGVKVSMRQATEPLPLGTAIALAGGVVLFLAGSLAFRAVLGAGPFRARAIAAVAALMTIPLGLWAAEAELVALLAVIVLSLVIEGRQRPTDAPESALELGQCKM